MWGMSPGRQGIVLVLAYVAISSANAVFLSSILSDGNIFAVLLCVFCLVTVFFWANLLAVGGFKSNWRERAVWRDLIWINFTTAGCWFSFFFAIKSIEPALTSVIGNAVMPLTTIVISVVMLRALPKSTGEVTAAAALLACMLATGWVVFYGRTGQEQSAPLAGFVASMLCGIFVSLNTVVSKRLNSRGVTAVEILSTRFFLLLVLAALFTNWDQFPGIVDQHYAHILLVAVLGNLVPLFCLQAGIARIRPVVTSFLIGLSPLVYLAFQGFSAQLRFSVESAACIALSTAVILYGVLVSHREVDTTNLQGARA